MYPDHFLFSKLNQRIESDSLRKLTLFDSKIDFSSNDYLGIVHEDLLQPYLQNKHFKTGSTGSRLLSGNYALAEQTEKMIANFHDAESALLFNSGYDANVGLLSCVPQKGDTVLYDKLSHASLRDGIRLSFADAFSFAHNHMQDLEQKLQKAKGNIFIVTESVFSMDGDLGPLKELIALSKRYTAHLIIDEAHATGIIGTKGEGLVQSLRMQTDVFARICTFGKALGCHGAVVVGSERLRSYLINFARSLMYSTALPEHAVAAIQAAYAILPTLQMERNKLQQLIAQFRSASLPFKTIPSETAIQAVVIPGNKEVKQMADLLQNKGFDIRPILYPTVPKGSERIRIVLHSFNTPEQLSQLLDILSNRES